MKLKSSFAPAPIVMATLALAGCGGGDDDAAEHIQGGNQSQFYREFVKSCIASAVEDNVAQDIAVEVCNCAAGKAEAETGAGTNAAPEALAEKVLAECVKDTQTDKIS